MKIILAAAIAAASITGTAFAGDIDAPKVITNTPTVMSDTQMDQIVAGNHVIRLVELRTGLSLDLIKQILKYCTVLFKTVRINVRQVVGDNL